MNYTKINDNFSISGALTFAELAELQQQGVDVIINSRFDGEDAKQISSRQYQNEVEALGMKYVKVPVKSLVYPSQAIQRFSETITKPTLKVHAFCRSGKRVAHLWALAQASYRSPQAIIDIYAAAGVDIGAIDQQLQDAAHNNRYTFQKR